jgi:NAD(P)-dependent dehydrogenase (short-subunit alcohol dehydrogenase family)
MKLKDKVIIVTGGSGLIGREIIKYLLHEKAVAVNVEINIETNIEKGLVNCDITSEASIESCIDIVMKRHGKIDGLVNNAYPRTTDWGNKFENVSLESWRKNIDMQMNSTFFFCQKVLEIMKKQKKGSIVNIASIYGVVGNDFTIYEGYGGTSPAAYSAIKGGIINFTRYLASYFGRYDIRVNSVSPGGIKDQQHSSFIERYENKVPLKRMGLAEEIAPAVAFLLSDDASYITGHNLMVDGGWTAI